MGLTGVLTRPYGALEAWVYDLFLAPVALDLVRQTRVRPWARLAPGARLLDVGCGGGHLVRHIADERPDLALVGLDLSSGQLRRARDRLAASRARAGFVMGSATTLPFADGAFDAVTSMGSLKHWPDRALGLSECARVLRPGGALVIGDFDPESTQTSLEDLLRRWHPPRPLLPRLAREMRKRIVRGSPSADEIREMVGALPLEQIVVRRDDKTPMLVLEALRSVRR
jgi:ubiquinone/menaquinone biosynthesis C-methylase UbiE